MHISGKWDIRVSSELREFFSNLQKKGAYYWKLSYDEAETLIQILCASYNVLLLPSYSTKNIAKLKQQHACGLCSWHDGVCQIDTFPRPHFKTVAHEVYHHIDFYYRFGLRKKTYDSSDKKKYAWNFAELLWKALKTTNVATTVPTTVPTTVQNIHVEVFETIDLLKDAFQKIGGGRGWRIPTKIISIPALKKLPVISKGRKIFALENGQFAMQWIS